jgi:hypothetical protein
MTPTEQGHFVGVDVVDVRDRRCVGKTRDTRFLSRVLNDVERHALANSPDPDAALWRLWSAKEAAFKVVSKVRGTPPAFVHAAFRVDLPGPLTKNALGSVEWEEISVFIQWHEMPGRVAALAWNGMGTDVSLEWGWGAAADLDPEPTAPMEALLLKLSERERPPLGVDEARIEVACGEGPKGRVPPEALIDGREAPADVSLSHHGKWLAWAIRLSRPPAQDGPKR